MGPQMDKLKLIIPNLGRVFNHRCGHAFTCTLLKQPSLLLSTLPKQSPISFRALQPIVKIFWVLSMFLYLMVLIKVTSNLLNKRQFFVDMDLQYKTFYNYNCCYFIISLSVCCCYPLPYQSNVCRQGWSLPEWSP